MSSPRNIVVSHVYSRDNKGDAALTSVLLRDLKQQYPKAKLTIVALQPGKGKFEGVREYESFMSFILNNTYPPAIKLARTMYMISATLAWAWWRRLTGGDLWLPVRLKKTAKVYATADMIVPVGGGHIRSQRGTMGLCNVFLLLHPLWVGCILKKPTILYSQSIGPFRNRLETIAARHTLQRMDLILLREDVSMQLLESLGVKMNVQRSIDSGFLHRSHTKKKLRRLYNITPNELLLGVTVRSWLPPNGQAAYEQAVASALDAIIKTVPCRVMFIPQVTAKKGDDDRTTSRRVYALMQQKAKALVIEDEPNHHEIKAIYDNLDILLGTRFHSVIFSLTSHVPVVAIEYEHKTSGIMHDLGLDEWVLKIEHVAETELTTKLHQLIQQRNHYKAYLQKNLPAYLQQAKQAIKLLDQAYQRHVDSSDTTS